MLTPYDKVKSLVINWLNAYIWPFNRITELNLDKNRLYGEIARLPHDNRTITRFAAQNSISIHEVKENGPFRFHYYKRPKITVSKAPASISGDQVMVTKLTILEPKLLACAETVNLAMLGTVSQYTKEQYLNHISNYITERFAAEVGQQVENQIKEVILLET
jgi:hypothetical protein